MQLDLEARETVAVSVDKRFYKMVYLLCVTPPPKKCLSIYEATHASCRRAFYQLAWINTKSHSCCTHFSWAHSLGHGTAPLGLSFPGLMGAWTTPPWESLVPEAAPPTDRLPNRQPPQQAGLPAAGGENCELVSVSLVRDHREKKKKSGFWASISLSTFNGNRFYCSHLAVPRMTLNSD